jgi:hypothetical protein
MRRQSLKEILAALSVLGLLAGLAGCGGGVGPVAGGGTGGTGLGVVTGFGSVVIDDETFGTDDDTAYFIDGEDVGKAQFKAIFGGTQAVGGAVALFNARGVQDNDFATGTLEFVNARTALKGPVTSLSPLQVLGQTVVITGDTVLADLTSIADLDVGNELEVYGFTRADNVIQATRIQRKAPGDLTEWKLTGFVTASNTTSFNVGAQTVSLSAGAIPNDCTGGTPATGSFVEVKAIPVSGFNPGDALAANKVECKRGGLLGELDDSVPLRRIQGFVSTVDGERFTVGGLGAEGQTVNLTGATTFRNGTREDLVTGVKVEVTGRFNTTTGVLTATRVSFREARVRIEAPLQAVSAETLQVLGITVQGSGLVDDEDNVLGGGRSNIDVEVRGFRDRNGDVFATEIRDRGAAGNRDLRLRGPVDQGSIVEPNFSILGVQIVPDSGTRYEDSRGTNDDVEISQQQFFSTLTAGQPVQVKKGSFSAGRITGPEEIELED